MKTKRQTQELDDFQNELLKRPECVIGGVGGDDGDIDKDKVGTIPGQGY